MHMCELFTSQAPRPMTGLSVAWAQGGIVPPLRRSRASEPTMWFIALALRVGDPEIRTGRKILTRPTVDCKGHTGVNKPTQAKGQIWFSFADARMQFVTMRTECRFGCKS